ncbi:CHAT domain-containing tetratricopeptide repeat protein [Chryseolinea sp. H1M3-3]|uniref:CHAT domain-containing protein n=1 Tax=Chryseolinea sp. H1M3-3 TaxID=3034144 RepID=UPI0023EAC608|nr:CHAT domain-containing tetratricopeptide repeat protein [Chryseolinea sp. H1M3-3]
MTLTLKFLLVIFFTAILHVHAFSQEQSSARQLYNSGNAVIEKDPDRAFRLFAQAMNLSRQKSEWEIYLAAINKLTSLNLDDQAEKKDQVLAWLEEAVNLTTTLKNSDQLATLHYNIAELYNLAYEIDLPIKHYEKAKAIWIALHGDLNKNVADCFHGLGDVYKYNKFDFHEAEKCYEKALQIREQIHLEDVKVVYKNYYSLAATNRSQRDFEKAISYGSKTLEMASKLTPTDVEKSNGMVANIYRDMGNTEEAKVFYLKALELNERTKDLSNRAWYYLSLGETYRIDSLNNEALIYFKKAYELYKRPEVRDQDLFVNLLIDLIDAYSIVGDHKNFYKTIAELFRELKSLDRLHSREAAQTWFVLGGHHTRNAKYDSALFYYQKALIASSTGFHSMNVLDNPTEEQIGYQYYVSEILAMKAASMTSKFSVSRDVGFFNNSLFCLRLAEKLISKQRNTLDMDASKWQFLDQNYDLYENIISSLCQGLKNLPADSIHELAFRYFEQSKSRSLADALAEAEQIKQISNEDSLFRLHADLKRQLFMAQDAINKELDNRKNSGKISTIRADIVNLDQSIQACKLAIEQKYPGYFNVKYGYQTIPVHEIQQVLRNDNKVVLEYFWGNKAVYGLGISGDKIQFRRIGSSDSIRTAINKLMLHLADKHATMDSDMFLSFINNSYQLYHTLVQPFYQMIGGGNRLQIIPDGLIGQIPFEVLIEEQPINNQVNYQSLKYLIKSFTIGYAYASSMLVRKDVRSVTTPSLLAIGFTGGESFRAGGSDLEMLAGAQEELKSLEKRFADGRFLTDNDATESNFKTLAPAFDILHLAIHGVGDVKRDFAASLYFGKSDNKDDGELHAYELYGLRLKALMAVLSSCESGVGKDYRGEGMISMASAFIYSGCENILMSLWKVNDQASTALMDNFYKHLLEGNSIDDALREAKLDYLKTADELTADPKAWSPLVAYGNLEPVFKKDRSRTFIYIGVGIALLVFLLLSRKAYQRFIR